MNNPFSALHFSSEIGIDNGTTSFEREPEECKKSGKERFVVSVSVKNGSAVFVLVQVVVRSPKW